MKTELAIEKPNGTFLHSAQLMERYISKEYLSTAGEIVTLHNQKVLTLKQWDTAMTYKYCHESVFSKPMEDQIMFLLFIAAAEGEL